MRNKAAQRGVSTVLVLWLVVALCSGVWVVTQRSIDARRDLWPSIYPLMFLPSGQYLRASSFGYRVLMSDVIYLWSIQYYGHHRGEEGRRFLWHIFEVVTELDPRFIDGYLTGALIMAADMGNPEMAVRLIERGMEANPDSWILPLNAGFYCWLDLEDYDRARQYFEIALAIPAAPPWTERLRAYMIEQAGNLMASLQMWGEIYDDAVAANDESTQSIALQHMYRIRVRIDLQLIEAVISRFRTERGQPPPSLEALVRTGYLGIEPINPNGNPYSYDPTTGEVADPDQGQRRGIRG